MTAQSGMLPLTCLPSANLKVKVVLTIASSDGMFRHRSLRTVLRSCSRRVREERGANRENSEWAVLDHIHDIIE